MKRERNYLVFRLLEQDHQLLRELAKHLGLPDRHEALERLAAIVPSLDLPDARDQHRRPLRIGVPPKLQEALAKKQEETGQPLITILLAAAQRALEEARQD
jgi:hypothetical protein